MNKDGGSLNCLIGFCFYLSQANNPLNGWTTMNKVLLFKSATKQWWHCSLCGPLQLITHRNQQQRLSQGGTSSSLKAAAPRRVCAAGACSACRDCCGPLIITCSSLLLANLFCSLRTQMNINAMEDDSHAWVSVLLGHADADSSPKAGTNMHTHTGVFSVLHRLRRSSRLAPPPFQRERQMQARADCSSVPDTLSEQLRDGEKNQF